MSSPVRAKKHLGQHFLTDKNIAKKIVGELTAHFEHGKILEIGPGTGVLTQFLVQSEPKREITLIEIDKESVAYLKKNYAETDFRLIEGDFLDLPLLDLFDGQFAIIGNFPYNISSQIFFKVLEHKNHVPIVVGMVQKEVAERMAAPHGSKTYGILSVLLQAFYEVKYCFTVNENVFNPPPKVKSAVIRLERKADFHENLDEKKFFLTVKTAFNQRRKTMRNSLRAIIQDANFLENEIFDKRPEQLSVLEFVNLTKMLFPQKEA